MPKRWAALPWGTRWLIGIAAVVLALAIVWALFVPVADWLAHHDVGSVKGSLHETAVDNARGRLLTLGAGLFAAGALVFTARNFTLSREGQVTDRYTKAIEQLGSDKLDVRIGGIYALERVARDSARDHPTVMEVLSAFIREHSHDSRPGERAAHRRRRGPAASAVGEPDPSSQEQKLPIRPDVQAAITVIARRNASRDVQPIALSGADLSRANLAGGNLAGAVLSEMNLSGANLTYANLSGAVLSETNLAGANLLGANLSDASLFGANLAGAILLGANLSRANLSAADLSGAAFLPADARFGSTIFSHADLTEAKWPGDKPVPVGWTRDPGSGRLSRES